MEEYPLITRPQDFRLGETAGEIRLARRDEVAAAARLLISQARRSLHIFSFDLEPAIYDQPEIIHGLSELARSSPRVEVRILIQDSGRIVRDGHRLIPVIQRLPSRIEVRRLHLESGPLPEDYLVADADGYLHRRQGDLYDGTTDFHAPLRAAELVKRFMGLWESSQPDPNLRRLST